MSAAEDSPMVVLGPDRDGRCVRIEGRWAFDHGDQPVPAGAVHIECADATIEPGDVNAHTHLYSGLAPLGLPEPKPTPQNFVQILERVWWRLDRGLDADSLRAAARLYVAHALLAGTTSVFDHHESPQFIEGSLDVLAQACTSLGIRALLCYGATDRNGGPAEGQRGIDECIRLCRNNRDRRVAPAIALHASFTVSDETIQAAARACRDHDAVMHVHVAEDGTDRSDTLDAKQRGYPGPLERLMALDALPPGSILAHGIDLDAEQVARFEATGGWIVQNPRSNEGNRVGYPEALAAAQNVALGTDGYPAVMADERAALHRLGAEHDESQAVLQARIEAGHRLAEARFGHEFGLPRGSGQTVADLVVRPVTGPAQHVFVDGRRVVADGRLVAGDLDRIEAEAREQAARLWRRMAELR